MVTFNALSNNAPIRPGFQRNIQAPQPMFGEKLFEDSFCHRVVGTYVVGSNVGPVVLGSPIEIMQGLLLRLKKGIFTKGQQERYAAGVLQNVEKIINGSQDSDWEKRTKHFGMNMYAELEYPGGSLELSKIYKSESEENSRYFATFKRADSFVSVELDHNRRQAGLDHAYFGEFHNNPNGVGVGLTMSRFTEKRDNPLFQAVKQFFAICEAKGLFSETEANA